MRYTRLQRQAQMVSFADSRLYFTARDFCKAVHLKSSGRIYAMLDELVEAGWLGCTVSEGSGAIGKRKTYYMNSEVRNHLFSMARINNQTVAQCWLDEQHKGDEQ